MHFRQQFRLYKQYNIHSLYTQSVSNKNCECINNIDYIITERSQSLLMPLLVLQDVICTTFDDEILFNFSDFACIFQFVHEIVQFSRDNTLTKKFISYSIKMIDLLFTDYVIQHKSNIKQINKLMCISFLQVIIIQLIALQSCLFFNI